MLSSSSGGLSGLTAMSMPGLPGRGGVLFRAHAAPPPHAPRLGLYDDEDDDDEDDSEYGSCTEAPLYENVHDEDDDDEDLEDGQGVYENVVFEPPAYSNLVPQHRGAHRRAADEDEDRDDQVYANVPGPLEEAPTYDVPTRRGHHGGAPHQPQEYANLTPAAAVPAGGGSGSAGSGGLGVILEETESSSARSSSGSSSGRGSSCTSAASSLARSSAAAPRPSASSSPGGGGGGLSGLLARIRGSAGGAGTGGSPLVVGLTTKASEAADSHSRDSGLNDVGVDWSPGRGGTPPRTTYSPDVQQPTPERLARVQQQVRVHLQQQDQAESHYQSPRPQPAPQPAQQPKLSVRDLLGHFESQRSRQSREAAGAAGAPPGRAGSGVAGAAAGQRSYGFGSTAAVKSALRKSVSQPAATGGAGGAPADNRSYNSNSGYNNNNTADTKSYTSNNITADARSYNNNNNNKTADTSRSYTSSSGVDANSYTGTAAAAAAPAARRSPGANNDANNKLSSGGNVSRRSFLDSIIAGAASADGAGRAGRPSSRRSSATMEEVNNVLNAAPPHGAVAVAVHPALRKAASTGSPAAPAATGARTVDAPATPSPGGSSLAGSLQDIPSIVDQLPDDDRPQESRRTTSSWDPSVLVAALYAVAEPLRDKPRPVDRVNVEGFLERLPSGRTKATFWNAWKRCYFRAKDGYLHCYAGKHSEKPMDVTQLMGGLVEPFESMVITAQDRNPATVPVIGIDDRMGHYLVVRANTPEETDRWTRALQTHTVEDFCSTYVLPWPVPRAPAMLRDSIVVDLGSRSVRAGILCSQPSLPQVFFPSVCATRRGLAATLGVADKVYGAAALQTSVRANSTLGYPIRPSERINKHTVDLAAVSGLLRVVFQSLSVDPRDYGVVVSVPRTLDAATQSRLVGELFDRFGVRSVLLSHQTVLALYAYNAGSGVVVDVGERTDVVPIMDGYIVEGGVSRVPYGGEEMSGHVRRFLLQRAPPVSMSTVAEALLPRYALERLCYVSADYRADLKRAQRDPTEVAAAVSVSEFFTGDKEPTMESLTLDAGRFQAPEGLFHPSAWGLDHPGVHRMVYKAIQECSMDARKTMARSVFLAGGLSMLPGFPERLREELASLLPPAAQPKVHASPYRYHAAYLGACVLANSSGVQEMCLTKDEYNRDGGKLLRPWIL